MNDLTTDAITLTEVTKIFRTGIFQEKTGR